MNKTVKVLACALLGLYAGEASAQLKSHKVAFSGTDKKIIIYSASNTLKIQGYAGSEVVIESDASGASLPEEASGLKVVSAGSAVDNTGTGANTDIDGNVLKVRIPRSKYFGNFTVKVPKGLSISVKENGNAYGKWLIEGIDAEVEAQTSYSTLTIKDVSGPIIARCGYGKINVEYDKLNPAKPNSISASGAVDITLPADTKANLKIKSSYGEVFTDFDLTPLKREVQESPKEVEVKGFRETTARTQSIGQGTASSPSKATTPRVVEGFPISPKEATEVQETAASPSRAATPRIVEGFPISAREPAVAGFTGTDRSALAYYNDTNNCDCDVNSTINGGGVTLNVRSDYGNVYIRKKK
jgi:hypothetical protein